VRDEVPKVFGVVRRAEGRSRQGRSALFAFICGCS
jgi:hypothetical protein